MGQKTGYLATLFIMFALFGCQRTVNNTVAVIPGINLKYNSAAIEGTMKEFETVSGSLIRDSSACAIEKLDNGALDSFAGKQQLKTSLEQWRNFGARVTKVVSEDFSGLRKALVAKTESGDHDIIQGTPLFDQVDDALNKLGDLKNSFENEGIKSSLVANFKQVQLHIAQKVDGDDTQYISNVVNGTATQFELDNTVLGCFDAAIEYKETKNLQKSEERQKSIKKWLDRGVELYEFQKKLNQYK